MSTDESIATRMELLAILCRRAEEVLRRHPDCVYQDIDSVVMKDTEESRQVVVTFKDEMNRLHGKFGINRAVVAKRRTTATPR